GGRAGVGVGAPGGPTAVAAAAGAPGRRRWPGGATGSVGGGAGSRYRAAPLTGSRIPLVEAVAVPVGTGRLVVPGGGVRLVISGPALIVPGIPGWPCPR